MHPITGPYHVPHLAWPGRRQALQSTDLRSMYPLLRPTRLDDHMQTITTTMREKAFSLHTTRTLSLSAAAPLRPLYAQ